MSRPVMRFVGWTIKPDSEGPPVTYTMQCCTCLLHSGGLDDIVDAQQFALEHAGRNPSHDSFREIIVRSWRATPG